MDPGSVTDADYRRLLTFRTELRRFVRWSEDTARAHELTPALHQLLLAIRGLADDGPPTIGAVAEVLLVRHHSAVELVARAEGQGLITRSRDADDHRGVRLALSEQGAQRLEEVSRLHLEQMRRTVDALQRGVDGPPEPPGRRPHADRTP